MSLPDLFRNYLLNLKKVSAVTTKNYISDIKRFIRWFEANFGRNFAPSDLTADVIELFIKSGGGMIMPRDSENGLSNQANSENQNFSSSARSFERYVSTLRKFAAFLVEEKHIDVNPFEAVNKAEQEEQPQDLWHIKDFKDYLYVYGASAVTIKNYLVDINAFTAWAKETLAIDNNVSKDNISRLTTGSVEEYKDRLVNVLGMSHKTVNRKLSAIRKYLQFASAQGLLKTPIQAVTNQGLDHAIPAEGGLTLEDLKKTERIHDSALSSREYSPFPPLRLLQKLLTPYVLVEELIAMKIASVIHGKRLAAKAGMAAGTGIVASVQGLFGKRKAISSILNHQPIKNYPKELYAPHEISLANKTFWEKVIHHAKYTRPNWYKRYHNYAFAHYLHFALLVIYASGVAFVLYGALFGDGAKSKALAAPVAPPRILSFQGRLTDNNDNPITAGTNVRFQIYADPTATGAGNLLWQEVDQVSPDQDGIFSQLLGNAGTCSGTPTTVQQTACAIPLSVFSDNSTLYLGITIEATAELTPRQRLATVAYAANSETLQGMVPTTDGSAGTSNVVLALDSSGNLTIGGSANPTFAATGGQFKLSGQPLLLTTNTGSNGNVVINPDGTGKIDAEKPIINDSASGNLSPGGVNIQDKASILATESAVAAFTINNDTTGGDIFTASSSGTQRFTIANNGDINLQAGAALDTISTGTLSIGGTRATTLTIGRNGQGITLPGFTSQNGVLYGTFGTGVVAQATTATAGLCLVSGGSNPAWGACSTSTSYWDQSNGLLYPSNSTVDVAFGGTSTSAAKFRFQNINTGTPVASISANSGDNATFLTGDGNLATTNKQTLTIGGSSTGNVVIDSGSSSINLADDTTITGNLGVAGTTGISVTATAGSLTFSGSGNHDISASSGTLRLGTLTLNGGVTGNNQNVLGLGNLSAAGTVTFSGFIANGGVVYANSSGILSQTAAGSTSQCLTGGSTPAFTACPGSFWSQTNGLLYANNSTVDFAIGGQSTASAKFAIVNIDSGDPTATISGNTSLVVPTTSTTPATTLNLLNGGTLNIQRSVGGDAGLSSSLYIQNNGNVGVGTTTVRSIFNVGEFSDTKTSISLGTDSSAANYGLAAFNNRLKFIAPQGFRWITGTPGGTEVMTMTGGNLGINNTAPTARLDVGGSASVSGNLSFSGSGTAHTTNVLDNGTLGFYTSVGGTAVSNPSLFIGNGTSTVAGNIGIGTSTPTSTLHIVTSTGDAIINLAGNSGTQRIQNNGGAWLSVNASTAVMNGASSLELRIASAAKLAIDTNGNVGVGTTTPGSELYVTRPLSVGANGKALAIFDQIENQDILTASASGTTKFVITNGGNVGIQTSAPTNGTLQVSGTTRTALYIQRTDGSSNIVMGYNNTAGSWFSGMASTGLYALKYNDSDLGTSPTFTVGQTGNIGATGTITGLTGITSSGTITFSSLTGTNGILYGTNGTGVVAQATTSTSNLCLVSGATAPSWTTCPTGVQTSDAFWNQSNGLLYPSNSTVDLTIGGQSTASAKFAFINVNSGDPTATISGNLSLVVPTTGTTPSTTLNILNAGTFNIQRSIGGDAGLSSSLYISNTGRIGVNNTSPVATFDVRGLNGTIPAATFSAQTSVAAVFVDQAGVGDLFTASKSGATKFVIDNSGNVGIGTNIPTAMLDVAGNVAVTGTGAGITFSASGNHDISASSGTLRLGAVTLNGAVTGNSQNVTGLGNLAAGGTITFSSFTTNGGLLYTDGSGAVGQTGAGSAGDCLLSNGGGAPTFSSCSSAAAASVFWSQANGLLFPKNSTVDVTIGGQATSSAKFAFLNVNTGTPVASVSANSGDNATYLTGDGTLATTNRATLTIGNSSTYNTTGNVVINSNGQGNVGIGVAAPTNPLQVLSATATQFRISYDTGNFTTFGTDSSGNLTIAPSGTTVTLSNATALTASNLATITSASTLGISATTLNLGGGSAATIGTISNDNLTLTPQGTGTLVLTTDFDSAVMVGSASNTPAALSVSGGVGSNAGFIVNRVGTTDDIIAASASGTTKFVLSNSGLVNVLGGLTSDIDTLTATSLKIGTSTTNAITIGKTATPLTLPSSTITLSAFGGGSSNSNAVLYANGSNNLAQAVTTGSNFCLLSNGSGGNPFWASCNGGTTDAYWTQLNGALYPNNSTVDFLIGGQSTASAKFAFTNVNSGSPTATISGNLSLAVPTTGTTPATTLNILNAGTFNIQRSIGGDAGLTSSLFVSNVGNVGISNTSPRAKLDITGSASISANLSYGGSGTAHTENILDNGNLGFYTSVGGTPVATPSLFIANGTSTLPGNVGIGTTTTLAALDVRAFSGTTPAASISATTSVAAMYVDNSGVGDLFTASKSGLTKFVISNGGNVGIGTNLPVDTTTAAGRTILTVKGTTDLGVLELASGATDADGNKLGHVQFSDANSSASDKRVAAIIGQLEGNTANLRGGILRFNTRVDGNSSIVLERMRIDGNGNIDIGTTTNSGFKLQVAGNIGPDTGAATQSATLTKTTVNSSGDTSAGFALAIGTDGMPVIAYGSTTAANNKFLVVTKCGDSACSTGNTTTTVNTSTDNSGFVSTNTRYNGFAIIIGRDGMPVIAYGSRTPANAKMLVVTHCGKADCTYGNTTTAIDTTAKASRSFAMALGADGLPIIAYGADDSTGILKVTHCSNVSCSTQDQQTVIDSTAAIANGFAIAIGTDGIPIITYTTASSGGAIKTVKCTNVKCGAAGTTTSIDTLASNQAQQPAMAISADGLPLIAYQFDNGGTPAQQLKVAKCTTASCSTSTLTTLDGGTTASSNGMSMAVTATGSAIITYAPRSSALNIKVALCNLITCTGAAINRPDTAAAIPAGSSIAIGTDGIPVIAYGSATTGDNKFLTVAKCGDTGCQDNSGSYSQLASLGPILGGFMANAQSYGAAYQTVNTFQVANPTTFQNLDFLTAGSTKMSIQPDGNVGIGTTSPGALFEISRPDTTTYSAAGLLATRMRIINTNQTNNSGTALAFTTTDANGLLTSEANIAGITTSHTGNAVSGDLAFQTRNAGTVGEVARFMANATMGLGTSSPISELHVTRALATGVTGKALAIFDQIENQDIIAASFSGTTRFKVSNGGTAFASIFTDIDNTAYFYDGAATGTSLTTAGNVGIGTTSVDLAGFGVNAGKFVTLQSSNSQRSVLELSNNSTGTTGIGGQVTYENGTTQLAATIGVADGATNSGYYALYTNNAGSFTEKLRVDHLGNVGIGNGSVTASGLVHAYGTGSSTVDVSFVAGPSGAGSAADGVNYAYAGASYGAGKSLVNAHSATAANGALYLAVNATRALSIINSGNVGIGTASAALTPTTPLYVGSNSTNTNADTVIAYITGDHSNAGSTVGQYALDLIPTYSASGTLGAQVGMYTTPRNNSTGTISNQYSILSQPFNISTGTITNQFAGYNQPYNFGGGPIGNQYGLYSFPTNASTGTITAQYGVFAQVYKGGTGLVTTQFGFASQCLNQAAGAVTNCYANYVYAPSAITGTYTNKYAFVSESGAGNVGINTVAPVALLDVSGGSYNTSLRCTSADTIGCGLTLKSTDTGGHEYHWISTGAGATPGAGTLSVYDTTVGGTNGYRMVINTAGNIGIGASNTSPGDKLDVLGGNGTYIVSKSTQSGNTWAGFKMQGFATSAKAWTMGGGDLTGGGVNQFFLKDESASSTRMWMDNNGNLGIGAGVAAATGRLDILNDASAHLYFDDYGCGTFGGFGGSATLTGCTNYNLLTDGTNLFIGTNSTGDIYIRESNGLINNSTTGHYLCYDTATTGKLNYGASCASSALRFKHDITPLDEMSGIEEVMKLKPVSFVYNPGQDTPGAVRTGFIAEDIEQLDPRLAIYGTDGQLQTIHYDFLTAVLAKAIQQQQGQITDLNEALGQGLGGSLDELNITAKTDSNGNVIVPHIYNVANALGTPVNAVSSFASSVIGNLRAGGIKAEEVTTNTLAVATDSVSIAGTSLQSYIISTVQSAVNAGQIAVGAINGQPIVSPLASIDEIHTNTISPLASSDIDIKGNINIKDANGQTKAKITTNGDVTAQNATLSGTLAANNASVSGNLSSNTIQTTDATVSGTLYANNINANSITGLDAHIQNLLAGSTDVSTISAHTLSAYHAQIADAAIGTASGTLNTNFVDIQNMSADFGTFRQGLIALGPATFNQLTALDSISIGTTLTLGPNSIDTLGEDLNINPLKQGAVSFLAGAIRIETDGTLHVNENAFFAKDVEVHGTLKTNVLSPLPNQDLSLSIPNSQLQVKDASNAAVLAINNQGDVVASGSGTFGKLNLTLADQAYALSDSEVVATGSAGTAIIKQYHTELTIDNPLVTAKSLIYITPVGSTNQVISLLRQVPSVAGSQGSFTVGIPTATLVDVKFNWIIVN